MAEKIIGDVTEANLDGPIIKEGKQPYYIFRCTVGELQLSKNVFDTEVDVGLNDNVEVYYQPVKYGDNIRNTIISTNIIKKATGDKAMPIKPKAVLQLKHKSPRTSLALSIRDIVLYPFTCL